MLETVAIALQMPVWIFRILPGYGAFYHEDCRTLTRAVLGNDCRFVLSTNGRILMLMCFVPAIYTP